MHYYLRLITMTKLILGKYILVEMIAETAIMKMSVLQTNFLFCSWRDIHFNNRACFADVKSVYVAKFVYYGHVIARLLYHMPLETSDEKERRCDGEKRERLVETSPACPAWFTFSATYISTLYRTPKTILVVGQLCDIRRPRAVGSCRNHRLIFVRDTNWETSCQKISRARRKNQYQNVLYYGIKKYLNTDILLL